MRITLAVVSIALVVPVNAFALGRPGVPARCYTHSMGGKRIAEQVRRALIAAAKMGPIVAVLESAGCHAEPVATVHDASKDGG